MKLNLTLFALALAVTAGAGQTNYAAGSQAATWLKLPNSARTAAMGEAGVAVADDVNSLSINPAGLSTLKGQQVSFLHHAYVQDSAMEHVAYGMGVMENSGLALGVDYLSFGAVETFAVSGPSLVSTGTLNPSGYALNLAYGQAIGPVAAGINAKMISQDLGNGATSAFAGDLGLLWKNAGTEGLSFGASVQNLGSQLDGSSLPLNIKAGTAYAIKAGEADHVLLALDANVPSADPGASTENIGAEYSAHGLYALRAGYKLAGNGGVSGFSAGAGMAYSVFGVDYAFVSQGVLGSSNQVSLNVKF